jgi:hypothetical protein
VLLSHLFNESTKQVLDSFIPKENLNPKFWDKDLKLKPAVKTKLLKIADQYYKFLDNKVPIKDIIFTGSNANYNWSSTKFSDIDLHLVIQYSDIDENEELILKYMFDKKSLWAKTHDITIYEYDVELFAQDEENKLPFDAGVYSLKQNKWIQEPKQGIFKFNSKEVLDKAKHLEKECKVLLSSKTINKTDDIENLLNRISKLRKETLKEGGEFDPSNLAFKYLRRKGYIDKLKELKNKIIDKELTLR